jgi:glycosyltransferase involved in cell wall biosynthesis
VHAAMADPAASELVIVVDGDDEASWAELRSLASSWPRLVAMRVSHRGHLGALEAGVRRASGQIVVLLDDDVLPGPGYATAHRRHHAERPGLVVMGAMPVRPPAGRPDIATTLYAREYRAHCHALESGQRPVLDGLWMGNVSMRRADCLRIGLVSAFEGRYFYDRELGFRLADAGLSGRFDPSIPAVHLHRRSDQAFLRDARRQGASLLGLHRLHPHRLGELRLDMLVSDLPAPARLAIRIVGGTRVAPHLARVLVASGSLAGSLGLAPVHERLAKLARRLAQWEGAVRGTAP